MSYYLGSFVGCNQWETVLATNNLSVMFIQLLEKFAPHKTVGLKAVMWNKSMQY